MRLLVVSWSACVPPPGRSVHDPDHDFDGDGLSEKDGDCDDSDPDRTAEADWYVDADGDGHGDPATATSACAPPPESVALGGDCDDTRSDTFPGAPDPCDGADQACDGLGSEADADGDGAIACLDCDDTSAARYPAAPDPCDGIDAACDGSACEPAPALSESYASFTWTQGPGDAGVVSFSALGPGGQPAVAVGAASRVSGDGGSAVSLLSAPDFAVSTRLFPSPGMHSFLWPIGDTSGDGTEDLLALSLCVFDQCLDEGEAFWLDGASFGAGSLSGEGRLVGEPNGCVGRSAVALGEGFVIASPCVDDYAGAIFFVQQPPSPGEVIALDDLPSMVGDPSLSSPGATMGSGDLLGDGVEDLAIGNFGGVGGLQILFVQDAELMPIVSLLDAARIDSYLGANALAGIPVIFLPAPSGASWLVAGAPGDPAAAGGRIHLFDAPADGWLVDSDLSFTGPSSLGVSVAAVGDVDGDGIVDLAAGAPTGDDIEPTGSTEPGRAYVVSGADVGGIETDIEDVAIAIVDGEFGAHLGFSIAGGDLDGDGFGDLIVGQEVPLDAPAVLVFTHILRDPP